MTNENEPISDNHENKQLADNKTERKLENLTDRNWLFIKHYFATGKVIDSYKLAGYKSDVRSAPYVLFNQLKARIEEIGNMDITSRARLQADLNRVLDLPLASDKKELSIGEWLKVRKFAASITPELQETRPQISVLVINRHKPIDLNIGKSEKVIAPTQDIPNENIIDIEPISED